MRSNNRKRNIPKRVCNTLGELPLFILHTTEIDPGNVHSLFFISLIKSMSNAIEYKGSN